MKIILAPLLAAVLCASCASGLPVQRAAEFIKPGDNLVIDGIPPISAMLPATVNPYTEYRPKIFASWHPIKREMLMLVRAKNTNQVHTLAAPGAKPQPLTDYTEPVSGASFQPINGHYFVFSKDTGGNEVHQYYRYDWADKKITQQSDERLRNEGARWSHKGDAYVHTALETDRNRQTAEVVTQVRVAYPDEPAKNRLLATLPGGGWGSFAWSPDDKQLAMIDYASITDSKIWLLNTASGEKTLLTTTAPGQTASYRGVSFSADGRGIYTTSDAGSEFLRLTYIDLASKLPTVLTPDLNWDVEDFELSRDGKTLAYVANENGVANLHLMDVQTRRAMPSPDLPKGVMSGLQWHRNNRELAFSLASAKSPADIYSYHLQDQQLTRWTSSQGEGRDTADFAEPQLVAWKSFDAREISGFLYRAPQKFSGKRPVIINIHGGPEAQYRPGFLARNNYFMNELGVHMIFPNVRGSSGYGKTFVQIDNGKLREDSVKDIGALFDWIATQPDMDAARIMVTGGSYGGYMSLAVATRYADKIAASIDVVGISNFVTFLERTESYRRDLRRVEYGDERDPDMRAFLQKISPLNRADKISKPIFIVQGKNDPRVPVTEAEQMVATLKKSATPVWYLMANDEGHGFAKKSNADFQFYATIEFVKRHLLN